MAARLVTVTLVRAWEPGAAADEAERIEFAVALDPQGQPDARAWHDDPSAWTATRHLPGRPPERGEVAHDEEGWQLRFHPARGSAGPGRDAEAPGLRLPALGHGLRPGEVLTLSDPQGAAAAWRVVGVG